METRDYEYVVYPSTRVEGKGIIASPTRLGDRASLEYAKALAKDYAERSLLAVWTRTLK